MIALNDRFPGKVATVSVAGPARTAYPGMRPFRGPIGWNQRTKT
jgi:hypothetical protein